MGELIERSEWYRGKEPILEEMTVQRRTFLGATAARGFNEIPGLLIEGLTDLELKIKKALSSLNYDIAAKAIERELAQQGIDYDLAYKNAAILWEVEKAGLLDTLTRELADMQKLRDDREQFLAGLAVELGLRQIALINAKTIIEVESEEIKKEIVLYQGLAMPYEVTLAQQRLATAQKKMEIIPHLQALITAEENLIAAEEINMAHSQDLINARVDQIPIKEDLIGLKDYLVAAKDALTSPLLSVADKKKLLAEARLDYETKAQNKIAPTNNLVTAMADLNTAMQLYINKRGELVDPYLARATKLSELIAPTNAYAEELLKTIPYIIELANKQQELIAPSMAKAAALRTLVTPLLDKAAKSLAYAQTLTAKVDIERVIKEISYDLEALRRVGIDADIEVMNKRLEEDDYQKALIEADVILKTLETNHRAILLDLEASDDIDYATVKETGQTEVVAKEKEAATLQVDTNYAVAGIKMVTKDESVRTTTDARAGFDGSIEKIGRLNANEREKTAEIAANAKITSTLIHQIR